MRASDKKNTDNGLLSEPDVRSIIRLLGEVCVLPGDHADKKRYLMEGLCRLISVDAWVWALAAEMDPAKFPVYVGFLHGGFEEEQFAKFLKIQTHRDMIWLTAPFSAELHQKRQHLTRTLQQIDQAGRFLKSDVAVLWDDCGVHPRCLSLRPLDEKAFAGIALYRKTGSPLFDERETRIAHILMTEVSWLHEQGWPEDRGVKVPQLSPRVRLVTEMLLQGYSRKQIAEHLNISIHTASGYVKEIYRHLGVQSHAELLRRFYRGDGGDRT